MAFVIQRVSGRQISLSEVRGEILRIGRGTNAELRSDNPAVALEHAVIQVAENGYVVSDKGSITGTYVNRKPVETARLAKGDVIEIGDLRIEVQVAESGKPLFLRLVETDARRAAGVAVDDEVQPVAAAARGGVLKAPKIDYTGAYSLTRPWLPKASLIAIALIVALAVLGEVIRPENHHAFMPGGVSSAHTRARDAKGEAIGNDCLACHHPWKGVTNERCEKCHQQARHADNELAPPACMSCHAEHRQAPQLALAAETSCVGCHSDLIPRVQPAARASLGDHARITAFGVDHPPLTAERDESSLRFNHRLHLRGVRNEKGQVERLACTACHGLADAKGAVDPVPLEFEKHCARCHQLTFDARFPTEQVPHGGETSAVYGYILAVYSGNRDILGKSPQEVRTILSRRAAVRPDERAVLNAEQVVKKKCPVCHDLVRDNQRLGAAPPKIRTTWFHGAPFTHTRHRNIDCEQCHTAARASMATSDVLMPSRDACIECHGPRGTITAKSERGCALCHDYHQRSPALLTASVTREPE